jgi:hypothetical protein
MACIMLYYTPVWRSVISLSAGVCYAYDRHNCVCLGEFQADFTTLLRPVFLTPAHASSQSPELSIKYFIPLFNVAT